MVATTAKAERSGTGLGATSAEKQELTKAVINEKQDKEIAQAAAQQLRDEIAGFRSTHQRQHDGYCIRKTN